MAAAATTGTRLLLIDGAEQVLTDGGALLGACWESFPALQTPRHGAC